MIMLQMIYTMLLSIFYIYKKCQNTSQLAVRLFIVLIFLGKGIFKVAKVK